ncbi:MAG: class IV adenylate cyclase [Thermoplasmata archaeon]|nr:class IV adenylate cyclase [Thermoplasmatales archaeon]PMP75275.1 MAG: class IV adenylate cyclase [Aciduliprofundum sp.]HEU12879.1 class IV adenylate cyclase [Euryarchaeota archaeon]
MENELEIEIKAPISEPEEFEKKVRDMGGEYIGEEVQEDEYFNHPCRDFRYTDEALRLRKTGGSSIITYKGKRIDLETKTRMEIESRVNGDMRGILIGLGFSPVARIRKIRRRYMLEGVEISIDSVEGLGTFVELETHGDYERGKERLFEIARKLSLEKFERRSYLEMVVEGYGRF